MYNKLYIY